VFRNVDVTPQAALIGYVPVGAVIGKVIP